MHLELHSHLPNFKIVCVVVSCQKRFQSVGALKCHCYRKHIELIRKKVSSTDNTVIADESTDLEVESEVRTEQAIDVRNPSVVDLMHDFQQNFTLFLLKLQEKHILPKVVQLLVTDAVKSMFSSFTKHYNDIIKFQLSQSGYIMEDGSELQQLLQHDNFFENALDSLCSETQLKNYCRANMGLVEPVQYNLLSNPKDSFQYVPILDVLRLVLQKKDIWDAITSRIGSEQNTLNDYCDGSIYATHSLFSRAERSIQINMYTDEFEVVNPLGSKKSIHKVSAWYFSIGNLDPQSRSQLKHIYLSVLCRHKFLKERVVLDEVLKPLIDDLKKLYEEGITITVDGKHINVRGALATISADNLSAHSIAGFSCSFSSGRFCRWCMTHHSEIAEHECESRCLMRTSQGHKYHVQSVLGDRSILPGMYGVSHDCPFSRLPYFDTL